MLIFGYPILARMIPSEELHQLIQSMNMSEKRYFKIFSGKHVIGKGNNYVRLFDAIDRQKQYDETLIKRQFASDTFINHLPSEKNYLYQNIMESLNSFHKDKSFLARYCNVLISIEILYNKGLFEQCKKLINKAKKEAYSLDKFSVILLILRWELIIAIKDEDEKGLYNNLDEEVRLLDTMRVQAAFTKLAFQIQIQVDKGSVSEEFLKEIDRKVEILYPYDESINSFWTKYYYHSAKGLIYTVQKKTIPRNQCYVEIKEIMDEAPQFIRDLPSIYHLNYNNLVNGNLMLKKYKEAKDLIGTQRKFLQTYGIKNQTVQKIVFLNTYENELYMHYKTGNFNEGAAIVKKIEAEVKRIKPSFSPVLYDLLFFMAVADLQVSNYSAAIKWLNRILNAQHAIYFRKELQLNTRLLYLIVLHESEDWLFENRMNATKRIFAQEPQYKAQANILEGLRLLFENKTTTKNKNTMKKLLVEIGNSIESSNEERLNKTFDFLGWMRTRAKEQKFI